MCMAIEPVVSMTAMPTIFTSMRDKPCTAPDRPLLLMLAAGLAAAFWPLAAWYVERMRDGSDDPLGVLALAAAAVFLWRSRRSLQPSLTGCIITSILLGVVLVFQRQLPPLLEAVLAVIAVCSALALPRRMPGAVCLLILSLPVVASLQFFFGYPLRVATAVVAKGLLSAAGMEVSRTGTQLLSHGIAVGVDPPCSGVRMLWMGCFFAAVLASSRRLRARAMVGLIGLAVPVLLLTNGLRAALVVPGESGQVHWPHWLHEGLGLLAYAPALWLLVQVQARGRPEAPFIPGGKTTDHSPLLSFGAIGVLGLGIATGVLRSLPPASPALAAARSLPWPTQWNGQSLEPLALTAREQAFAESFPGDVRRFRCGVDEIVLRQVDRATRLLHSSRDCFQAAGYEITPQSQWRDAANREWSRFTAARGAHQLSVSECITNTRGMAWNDVGAWFWAALFHPGEGPWMAVTWITATPPDFVSP